MHNVRSTFLCQDSLVFRYRCQPTTKAGPSKKHVPVQRQVGEQAAAEHDLTGWKLKDLQAVCKARGLSYSGSKSALVNRLGKAPAEGVPTVSTPVDSSVLNGPYKADKVRYNTRAYLGHSEAVGSRFQYVLRN